MSYLARITAISMLGLTAACGAVDKAHCYVWGLDCKESGQDGKDGESIVGEQGPSGVPGARGERGPAGRDGVDGKDGATGATGAQGLPGIRGLDGTSCDVAPALGGALITCGTSTVLVTNGLDGVDGRDGQDGQDGVDGQDAPPTQFTVTEMINPCGDAPGADEVLLRLANNQLVAHYSSGSRQFLAVIGPGTYMTTDGTSCIFVVHPDMSVTW